MCHQMHSDQGRFWQRSSGEKHKTKHKLCFSELFRFWNCGESITDQYSLYFSLNSITNPNPARKKAVSCFKSYSPKSHENCFTTENYLLWEENSNSKQKNPFLQVLNSHTTKHIYRTWKRAASLVVY